MHIVLVSDFVAVLASPLAMMLWQLAENLPITKKIGGKKSVGVNYIFYSYCRTHINFYKDFKRILYRKSLSEDCGFFVRASGRGSYYSNPYQYLFPLLFSIFNYNYNNFEEV